MPMNSSATHMSMWGQNTTQNRLFISLVPVPSCLIGTAVWAAQWKCLQNADFKDLYEKGPPSRRRKNMCALSGKLDIQANGAGISGIAEDGNQQGIKVNKWTEVWNRKRECLCLIYLQGRQKQKGIEQGRKLLYQCTCIRFNGFHTRKAKSGRIHIFPSQWTITNTMWGTASNSGCGNSSYSGQGEWSMRDFWGQEEWSWWGEGKEDAEDVDVSAQKHYFHINEWLLQSHQSMWLECREDEQCTVRFLFQRKQEQRKPLMRSIKGINREVKRGLRRHRTAKATDRKGFSEGMKLMSPKPVRRLMI